MNSEARKAKQSAYARKQWRTNPNYKAKQIAYKKNHPEIMRYCYYKHEAKHRGFSFLLDRTEFVKMIKEPCFYCGELPNPMNGVDRKDNSIGYEVGNCVPCCRVCNFMKVDHSIEDFIAKCIKIVRHQKINYL